MGIPVLLVPAAFLLMGVLLLCRRRPKPFELPHDVVTAQTYYKLLNRSRAEVLTELRDMVERTPGNVGLGLAYGLILRADGQLNTAIHVHKRLLEQEHLERRVRAFVHSELAADYLAAGLLQRSVEAVQAASDLGFGDEELLKRGVQAYCGVFDWDGACDFVKFMGRKFGLNRAEPLAMIRGMQGERLMTDGEFEPAIHAFSRSVRWSPEWVPAHLGLCACYRALQRPRSALAHLERVKKRFENHRWLWLSELWQVTRDLEEPKAFFHIADHDLARDPEDWRSLWVMARARMDLGEFAFALDALRTCLQQAPHVLLLHQTVWQLIQQHQEPLPVMADYMEQMKQAMLFRNPYHCQSCHFSASQPLWRCPSCFKIRSFTERRI